MRFCLIATRRLCAAIVAATVVSTTFFACRGDAIVKHKVANSNALVGLWRSNAFEGQLGSSVESFCFGADGTVTTTVETQAGQLSNSGSYELAGNVLTLRWRSGSSATLKASVDSRKLVLAAESGKARIYKREAATVSCGLPVKSSR